MQQQIKDLMNKALDLIWFDPKNADNPSSVVVLVSPNDGQTLRPRRWTKRR